MRRLNDQDEGSTNEERNKDKDDGKTMLVIDILTYYFHIYGVFNKSFVTFISLVDINHGYLMLINVIELIFVYLV